MTRDPRPACVRPQPAIYRKSVLPLAAVFALSAAAILVIPTFALLQTERSAAVVILLVLVRVAGLFLVFHILGYWYYRCLGRVCRTHTGRAQDLTTNSPHVAIVVPIKDEPIDLVKRMLLHLQAISYPRYSVYFAVNGTPTDRQFDELLRDTNMHATLLRRTTRAGYKAGALNAALAVLPRDSQYVLVLDADHAPQPHILTALVPILERNSQSGFVQAAQRYERESYSLLSAAYCFKQRVFCEHICSGLAATGALFFGGTNALFRRTALDGIGGFDESSLTEDIRTTVHLHEAGWTGDYYAGTVAIGYPPFDRRSYYRQQRRWALGTFQNGLYTLQLFLSKPRSLSSAQWTFYLGWSGTYYLQPIASHFMLFSSCVFLEARLSSHLAFTDSFAFLAALLTLAAIAVDACRAAGIRPRVVLTSNILFFGDSLIYLDALVAFLSRRRLGFEVTNKVPMRGPEVSVVNLAWHGALGLGMAFVIVVVAGSGHQGVWKIVGSCIFVGQSLGIILVLLVDAYTSRANHTSEPQAL